MAFKGKTKIQIFDKSKTLKHELVEENLITNAAQNIVSLSGKDFFLGHRANNYNHMYYHLPNVTPVSTELFGGILLFENSIEENADTVFPPSSAVPVGHAGKSYSGPNKNRGSYNVSESGPLYEGTNIVGYRHVWDFATDKCNGSIGCICLTSAIGGNTGWKAPTTTINVSDSSLFDADTSSEVYLTAGGSVANKPFSTLYYSKGFAAIQTFARGLPAYGGVLFYINEGTGEFFYASRFVDATIPFTIFRGTLPRTITLGLSSSVSDVSGATPANLFTLNNQRLNGRHSVWYDEASNSIHILYVASETTLNHETYSLTGELLNRKTITVPTGIKLYQWTAPNVNPFLYKGYYFATVVDPSNAQSILLAKFSDDGTMTTTFQWYSPTNVRFNTHSYIAKVLKGLDRVSFRRESYSYSNESNETFFDGETFNTFKSVDDFSAATYVDCSNEVKPGFYMSYNTTYQGTVALYYKFIPMYLASINNLVTPVVKTSADTMKITYDLYAE